jgi:hypothetical protein
VGGPHSTNPCRVPTSCDIRYVFHCLGPRFFHL